MKTYSILAAVMLVLPVLGQDQDEMEKARKVFTADITRAILTGAISAPAGFDKAMTEHIGKKRLQALRSGDEMVQGRDNDLAGVCLARLGVKRESLKLPTGPGEPRREKIEVAFTGAKYKVAEGKTSGFFKTGQDADIVLSAIDFNDSGGALLFNHPAGIASDGTHLLLADTYNNRVLIWNRLPEKNVAPDLVLGQKDFTGNNSGAGRDQMNFPINVAAAAGKVVVADTENHRLLIWNAFPTKNGQPADLVVGPGRESGGFVPAKDKFLWPWGVWTDGKRLAVTSTRGGAVLIWNQFPTGDGQPADILLDGGGHLGTPRTITSDGKSLMVGDHNPKVEGAKWSGTFFWKKFPTKDGEAYDFFRNDRPWMRGNFLPDGKLVLLSDTLHVFESFPKDATDKPKVSIRAYNFRSGDHVGSVFAGGRLYVCCGNRNCIVVYNSVPTRSDQNPDFAIGSPDIGTDTLEKNFIISNPVPAANGKSLFVSSDLDRNLYVWKQIPDESGAHPDMVYKLDGGPLDLKVWKDTLVLAGHETVYLWKKLPLEGQLPDVIFRKWIGSVEFRELSGVALDDRYFYLADHGAGKVYGWKGIPGPDSEPAFTLNVATAGRLSSDSNYLAVATLFRHVVEIYPVNELESKRRPWIVGKRTDEGRPLPAMFNGVGQAVVAQGHLFVADGFNRVHVWRRIEDAIAGKWADVILGEDTFEDYVPETGRNKTHYPHALCFDGTYLWIAETKFSERLLRFSPCK